MKNGRWLLHFALLFFVSTLLSAAVSFAGPGRTTYQAKIIKPDGYPLEAASVHFKFTILDPSATCILYSENYNAVNMSSTSGLISFSLGSGVKSFPVSGTTFEQVFSNITPFLACDSGGPANYSPNPSDMRRIVMQFNDGNGWQTLPAMNINAVPYAMYANDTLKFNGLSASDFLQISTLPSCGVSEALRYNGASFSCVAVGGSGAVTSGSVVTALGYTPADGASVTAISSSLVTTNSNVSLMSSAVASVSSTVFSVSSTVSSLSSTVSSLQTSVAASLAAMTSSQWSNVTSGISYSSGSVGIGTSAPTSLLDVGGYGGSSFTAFNSVAAFASNTDSQSGIEMKNKNAGTAADFRLAIFDTGGNYISITQPSVSNTGTIFGLARNNTSMIITNNASGTTAHDLAIGTYKQNHLIFGTSSYERMRITSSGAVGIGTSAPTTRLDVAGGVRIGTEASACTASLAGTLRYSGGNVEYCNGTTWSSFNAGAITSSAVISALAYTPVNQTTMAASFTAVATTTNNLSTSVTALATSLTTLNSSVSNLSASMGAITSSQWKTSGANIYYNTGKVGIGTSSPTTPLDVTSDSGVVNETATVTLAQYNSVSAATNSSLIFRRARGPFAAPTRINASDIIGGIYANGFYDDGAGSAGFASQNSGAIRFMADENFASSGTLGTRIVFDTTQSGTTTRTTKMVVTGEGNIGIGTTAPEALLQIVGKPVASGATVPLGSEGSLMISTNPSGGTNPQGFLGSLWLGGKEGGNEGTYKAAGLSAYGPTDVTPTSAETDLLFYTTVSGSLTANEKMRIMANGYVGVGTSSPASLLHLYSNTAQLRVETNNPSASGNAPIYLLNQDTTANNVLDIFFATNDASLEPDNGAIIRSIFTARSVSGVTADLAFLTASNAESPIEKMRLTSSGNLGLGTASPTARLHFSAGSTTLAPLKFTSGTLLSSAQAGAMEYDGTNFYVTDSLNQRRTIATGSSTGSIDNASTINSTSNITLAPTGSVIVSSTTASVNPTTGALVVNGGAGVAGDVNVSGIVTASNLALGVSAPLAKLDVRSEGLTKVARIQYSGSSFGTQPNLETFRSRGTLASPTAVLANDVLGSFSGVGYHGTAFASGSAAAIMFRAAQNFTATEQGSYVQFYTTASGTTAAAEKMRLDPSGYLGIGTATPLNPLHIYAGGITGMGFEDDDDGIVIQNFQPTLTFKDSSAGDPDDLRLRTESTNLFFETSPDFFVSSPVTTNLMTLTATGRLGLGTNNPAYPMTVSASTTGYNTFLALSQNASATAGYGPAVSFFGDTTNVQMGYMGAQWVASATADTMLTFGTRTSGVVTEKMRVTASGAVGIGTGTPTAPLTVAKATASGSQVSLISGANAGYVTVPSTIDGLILSSSRYNGSTWISDVASAAAMTIGEGTIQLYTNGGLTPGVSHSYTERMRIDPAGNVGIGTASALAKLHVRGNILSDIDSTIGILGQISLSGRNTTAATPLYTQWSIYNMKEYGSATGLGFYEYYDANNNGTLCDAGDVCAARVMFANGGNVGIAVQNPTYLLQLGADSAAKPGSTTWTVASDMRLKDSRGAFTRGMNELLGLETIYFTYKKDNPLGLPSDKEYVGIRAQDVQKVVPESVSVDEKGFLHFSSDAVFWTVVNAVKELYHKILGHDAQLEQHAREIASIKEENEMLKQQNADKDKQLKDIRAYLCAKDPSAPICQ